jgi:exosortase
MQERRLLHTFHWPLSIDLTLRNGLFVFLLLIPIAAFWQPLSGLYRLTQEELHYSHLLLVPLVSLYAFYNDRKVIYASATWSPLYGTLLMGLGAIGYWAAGQGTNGVDNLFFSILALVVITWGSFLFCYGPGAWRTNSFGLLFLLFMVPLPPVVIHAIIVFLQRSAAELTAIDFSLFGVPVIRDDIVFRLSHITISVDEGCSAIRSAISLVISSVVGGHFFLRSMWTRLSIVALVVPLAIINNGFRIVLLSVLANYVDTSFLTDGSLHDLVGHFIFVCSIIILIVLISLARRFELRTSFFSAVPAEA